jgi:hypothetical protein
MLQKLLKKLFAGKPEKHKEPLPQCENNEHNVVFLEGMKRNYLICTKCGWKFQQ